MLSCSALKRSKVPLYFVYIGNESSDESLHAQIQLENPLQITSGYLLLYLEKLEWIPRPLVLNCLSREVRTTLFKLR